MLPYRQVHLDFHTSPQIHDVGVDFDAEHFVRTLRAGYVNSVTVFSRGHHGYCYYPTQVGARHPHLDRDLLGEMIEAGHGAGLRVPVYTTVVWDELSWATHPEWRTVSPQGCITGPSTTPLAPGWKDLCMNTGYADYVVAQIEEVLDMYDVDGLFIDIVRYARPCVCATCLQQMIEEGIDPGTPEQLRRFALGTERRFMANTTRAIRAKRPDAEGEPPIGIFYNSRLRMAWDPELGNRLEMHDFTHLEIESLPGGFWGYDHFPMFVRYFQTFDRELMAMTGRFHTAWGDFGGLRNRAALAFECFQGLAHGAVCSIGDQLHPRGRLDPAVYDRIGEVYAEVERREPWCVDTRPLPEIGVVTANRGTVRDEINGSDRGATHVLEQLKAQFQFVDAACDLASYELVILPDAVPVDEALAGKLRAYLAAGGKLLLSDRSGLDEDAQDFRLAEEMGVHYAGAAPFAPDYLVLEPELAEGIEPMHHVCQLQGTQVTADPGTEILARSGVPYFNRTWRHFCSHQYTPMERPTDDPVVVQSGDVIYVARPLFREYAESARLVHKSVLANCLKQLLPRPRVGEHNLPSAAIVTVRQQGEDLIVHLLHYVHQRRGRTLDMIEDVLPLHDVQVSIRADRQPTAVRLVPEEEAVEWAWEEGYVRLSVPRVDGYQIVQLVGAAS
jgi:hypothetical protein